MNKEIKTKKAPKLFNLGGATVFNIAAIVDRIKCAILLDASVHLVENKMPIIPILNMRQEAASYEEYLNVIMDEEDKYKNGFCR